MGIYGHQRVNLGDGSVQGVSSREELDLWDITGREKGHEVPFIYSEAPSSENYNRSRNAAACLSIPFK
jgi:hypothetical protein